MKRRCPCAQIETLIGLMPGEREFERITVPWPGLGPNTVEDMLDLWYCTSCGTVVFIPEEKAVGVPHKPGCMCPRCGKQP